MTAGAPLSAGDQLILSAATGVLVPGEDDLLRMVQHVVGAGFETSTRARVGQLGMGVHWQGQILTSRDRFSTAAVHYIRHVLGAQEWPLGTTLPEYLASIREVIVDQRTGLLANRYDGLWQLTFVRRSGRWRGPSGFN